MPEPESSSESMATGTSLERWLSRRGLQGNPFERWNAEHDQDLPNYFIDIGEFDELLRLTEPCVVFAGRGCGKTALRQMIAAQCRPHKQTSPRLSLVYAYSGFERALGAANDDIGQMRPMHHVMSLLYLGLNELLGTAMGNSKIETALARADVESHLAAYVARFAPHLARASTAGASSSLSGFTSLELLEGFTALIKAVGMDSCVVLVDGLDEFTRTAEDQDQAITFLAPLLGTLGLIECRNLAFKFFIPQHLEVTLCTKRWFRVDRVHLFRIEWDEHHLSELIRRRLIHFSLRKPPYEGLAQMCEDTLSRVVRHELVALAQGSPRAVLILANLLLHAHCEQPQPPELITLRTWEQVKRMWMGHRSDFVGEERHQGAQRGVEEATCSASRVRLDSPVLWVGESVNLVRLGDRDITAKISAQEYRTLLCLHRHRNAVCTRHLLAQEAWLGAEGGDRDKGNEIQAVRIEGVSDQAINASIARLRRVLKRHEPDVEYIKTVRGRGYRLYHSESTEL